MDLTSVLGSILSGAVQKNASASAGATAGQSSIDMGNVLKELAGNKGSDIFGTILKSVVAGSSQANANSGVQAGDILGTIIKGMASGSANNQASNGNILGAVLGQMGNGGALSNMSAKDILSMATSASTVLNTILGKK